MKRIQFNILQIALLLIAVARSPAQGPETSQGLNVSAGISVCVYQSVFSFQQSYAVGATLRGPIAEALSWQAGFRLGMESVSLPEAFGGALAGVQVGSWMPEVGMEIGVTRRAHFDPGKELLREMRSATEGDISPFYCAVQTAPLSFRAWDTWRLSFLELQVGTHFSHFGRTLRVQIGVVSVGRAL